MRYRIRQYAMINYDQPRYYGQFRPWWWPFWLDMGGLYGTEEEVHDRIVDDKAYRARRRAADAYVKRVD